LKCTGNVSSALRIEIESKQASMPRKTSTNSKDRPGPFSRKNTLPYFTKHQKQFARPQIIKISFVKLIS